MKFKNLTIFGCIPRWLRISLRVFELTLSKAPLISRNITPVISPSQKRDWISETNIARLSVQDFDFRNPNWNFGMKSDFSAKHSSLYVIIFSNIFKVQLAKEMGLKLFDSALDMNTIK